MSEEGRETYSESTLDEMWQKEMETIQNIDPRKLVVPDNNQRFRVYCDCVCVFMFIRLLMMR